ncbi:MAG: Ig-like domain-containing protein, partial [Acidimicrobiia bacterium]|nr:Ig-like domain-containing protein [Acidimicrobiia bacterium]
MVRPESRLPGVRLQIPIALWVYGRRWFRALLALTIAAATFVVPSTVDAKPDATIRDEFTDARFDGQHGGVAWSGSWIESGESDGPSAGTIQIVEATAGHCADGGCLRLGGAAVRGASIDREADLTEALRAHVSFTWSIDAQLGYWAEKVPATLDISPDGEIWHTIHTFPEGQFGPVGETTTYDVSAWTGGEVRLRITSNDAPEVVGYLYVDDVEIAVDLNEAPSAVPDEASTTGDPISIDVLANDSDEDGHLLSVVHVGLGGHGDTMLNADGTVTYTPTLPWAGTDEFSYVVTDGIAVREAAVRITGEPVVHAEADPSSPSVPPATIEPLPSESPGPEGGGSQRQQTATTSAEPAVKESHPKSIEKLPPPPQLLMDAAEWRSTVASPTRGSELRFEANAGQADPALDAVARGDGYSVVLTGGDAVLAMDGGDSGHEVRMSLRGAATDPHLRGLEPSASQANAPSFASVAYSEVYPGIDVVYSANGSELEYSFVVGPGADPATIALAFRGANSLGVQDDGSLSIDSRAGHDLLATAPHSFQEIDGASVTVGSSFVMNDDGTIGFAVQDYDPTLPLVIDPTFKSFDTAGNSKTTQITLTKPAGTAVDDLLVAQIMIDIDDVVFTPPAGWNLIREDDYIGNSVAQVLFYRVATASEPADYTFTFDKSEDNVGSIAVFSGVDTANPIDAHGGQMALSGNPIAPSITTTVANTLLVGFFGVDEIVTFTPPTGMTELWDYNTGTKPSISAADETFAGPGATGTRTATPSATQKSIAQLIALTPAPPWETIVNATGDSSDASVGDGVCDTGGLNSQSNPECTLRAAIEEANALAGTSTIAFNMPVTEPGHSGGIWTLTPGAGLPPLSTTILIDGTTQPGWATTPVVELNGASAGGTTDGFVVSGDNSEIRGLAINRFLADGIEVRSGASGTLIVGNHIGVDPGGLLDRGNAARGIDLQTGSGPTTVGGVALADGNVISGNGDYGLIIFGSNGNHVIGNHIG